MRALVYHSANEVQVDTVPDPILQEADDVIIRITATAICGSDLHLYRGKVPGMKTGDILGHEFMGEVVDTGSGVTALQKGDRVVVPFVIACGSCHFCDMALYSACETTNPDRGTIMNKKSLRPGAALFGFTHNYGGVPGGQAEYARVPKANVGPIKIPDALSDEQVLFLSDILPTGYQAVLNADVKPGSTVAIFGAGPVGQMAAACARMLGAEAIFMVDHHAYRLEFARAAYGVVPINFDDTDAAEVIISHTANRGVDAVIDAVGFEAKGSALETALTNLKLEGSSGAALRQCIAAVRRGGIVSVPGVYAGFIHGFLFGDAFEKGITIRGGQTHVQQHMPLLLERIWEGKLQPEAIITHRLPLELAAEGYRLFDKKQDNCRKVILRPGT
ncbi:alcohol dehydrogenase catalytic domain-containing protein [Pseudoduganella sp. FT55W]|uniref:Alcohol dehydrogenase catalytic domain-containing protein n=1 Tax=Duganella rivi TaxID=2666083 RepID=A0A7X4GMS3_9BURK|nr:zinc-dependent alcohol dehydrogenase [Duganella rivi]MYM65354.1 alcohol dehydrogenase catalytic domain-containing protein [Duganella rivi]